MLFVFHNIIISHITAEDYPMTFLPCSREGQVTLPIHDDNTVEKNTKFYAGEVS